jgi:hypothetical protein
VGHDSKTPAGVLKNGDSISGNQHWLIGNCRQQVESPLALCSMSAFYRTDPR